MKTAVLLKVLVVMRVDRLALQLFGLLLMILLLILLLVLLRWFLAALAVEQSSAHSELPVEQVVRIPVGVVVVHHGAKGWHISHISQSTQPT